MRSCFRLRAVVWASFLVLSVTSGCDDGDGGMDGGGPSDSGPAPADGGHDARPDDAVVGCVTDDQCSDDLFCNGVERCRPGDANADELGCVPADADPCLAAQTCNEDADRCETMCAVSEDADGDRAIAVECGGDDCDDSDPNRYPGNAEVCDSAGHDEDCDGATYGERDLDGDGEDDARCCNGATCGRDCNDLRPDIHPTAAELCDRADNDCDSRVDEGVTVDSYPDMDFDGHGRMGSTAVQRCPGTLGFSSVADDCDDTEPRAYTGAAELCDGLDNDCDGTPDDTPTAIAWYADDDFDLFGDPSDYVFSCRVVPGRVTRPLDCDDGDIAIAPGRPDDNCDAVDDDCDGLTDEDVLGFGSDLDGDGVPAAGCGVTGVDCNDLDRDVHPAYGSIAAAPEITDLRDNDCDGNIDEGGAGGVPEEVDWWLDGDRDSYGGTMSRGRSAIRPPGAVSRSGDCDDADPTVNPGARELCDGRDQDCDMAIDESLAIQATYADSDMDTVGTGDLAFSCGATPGRSPFVGDCDDMNNGVTFPAIHYRDMDMDTYGDPATINVFCLGAADPGWVEDRTDCDDMLASVNPMGTEVCDGVNQDCDLMVDEGTDVTCSLPNATSVCGGAAGCVVSGCVAGFDNCDSLSPNGCELPTVSDPMNCGGCGVRCAATEICQNSACHSIVDFDVGGRDTGCVVLGSGRVRCWGQNGSGQLGDNSTTTRLTADFVQDWASFGAPLENITQISLNAGNNTTPAGSGVACAVQSPAGDVLCWGEGSEGMNGATVDRLRAEAVAGVTGAVDVDLGRDHACALLGSGQVRCWGRNDFGQLGDGTTTALTPITTPVTFLVDDDGAGPGAPTPVTDAIAVATGEYFTCVLRSGPTVSVSCAGYGGQYRTGQTTFVASLPAAYPVVMPSGVRATSLSIGFTHACVLGSDGRPYCWGGNGFAQTGHPWSTGGTIGPTLVPGAPPNVLSITGGYASTCLQYMHPTGPRLQCFGSNLYGSLARGTDTNERLDAPADALVAAGVPYHGGVRVIPYQFGWCALETANEVVCWGSNIYGIQMTAAPPTSYPYVNPTAVLNVFP